MSKTAVFDSISSLTQRITVKPTLGVTALSAFKWCEYQAYYSLSDKYPARQVPRNLALPGSQLHQVFSELCLPEKPTTTIPKSVNEMYFERLITGIYTLNHLLTKGIGREVFLLGTISLPGKKSKINIVEGYIDQVVNAPSLKDTDIPDEELIKRYLYNDKPIIKEKYYLMDTKVRVAYSLYKRKNTKTNISIPLITKNDPYALQLNIYKRLFDDLSTGKMDRNMYIDSLILWYELANNIGYAGQNLSPTITPKSLKFKQEWHKFDINCKISESYGQMLNFVLDTLTISNFKTDIDLSNFIDKNGNRRTSEISLLHLFNLYFDIFKLIGNTSEEEMMIKYYKFKDGKKLNKKDLESANFDVSTIIDYFGHNIIKFEKESLEESLKRYIEIISGNIKVNELVGPRTVSEEKFRCNTCNYNQICDWRKINNLPLLKEYNPNKYIPNKYKSE